MDRTAKYTRQSHGSEVTRLAQNSVASPSLPEPKHRSLALVALELTRIRDLR